MLGKFARIAAGVAILTASTAAQAQDTWPLSMMLTCTGTDTKTVQSGTTTTVTVSAAPRAPAPVARTFEEFRAQGSAPRPATTVTETSPVYSRIKVPAHMTIVIEGASIRVRPSDEERPGWMGRKSPDGWYPLEEVAITDQQFRGRATWGGGMLSGKATLQVDRLTGDVTFGGFSGVCEKTSDQIRERKF